MENITGKVVKGIQKGRTLGFPTANIKTNSNIEAGIYAGYVIADNKKYSAALYFPGNKIAEAYIFDFEGNLYGKEVNVEILTPTGPTTRM